MISLKYFTRSAELHHIRKTEHGTVVVFMHGILSETRRAFSFDEQSATPWDTLLATPCFAEFNIALFSYGRTDFSFLLHGESPFNNLRRLAAELRALIKGYRNVILIAHSQGGLLAKTYASLYFAEQGILITTLHTPHGNRAFSVMRASVDDLWRDHASYVVPHLFCTSVNDNRIVKASNAITTGIDDEFVSFDESKAALGHSHLSSSPDVELMSLIRRKAVHFINSGLSHDFHHIGHFYRREQGSQRPVQILLSRSKNRLAEHAADGARRLTIASPWTHDFDTLNPSRGAITPVSVPVHGCSANYLVRSVFNHCACRNDDLDLADLDRNRDAQTETNDILCENLFGTRADPLNPYRALPFDVNDIDREQLICDREFIDIFSRILINAKFTLAEYIKLPPAVYRATLLEYHDLAIKKYQPYIVRNIYDNFPAALKIGPLRFGEILFAIAIELGERASCRCSHADAYAMVNRQGLLAKCKFGILGIEYVIASIFRCDGDLYWLDKNIKKVLLA